MMPTSVTLSISQSALHIYACTVLYVLSHIMSARNFIAWQDVTGGQANMSEKVNVGGCSFI